MLRDAVAFVRGLSSISGGRFAPLKLTAQQRCAIEDELARTLQKEWKPDEDMPENLPGPRI
jgi:hypothetical protein